MNNQKIIIITNVPGMLMISLQNLLMKQNIEVDIIPGNIKNVTLIEENAEAILLYMDETLADDQQVQIYLRDRCIEENTPLFIIGAQNELEDIRHIVSADIIAGEYTRPVNINAVAEDVLVYIKEHGRNSKKKVLVVDDSGAMLRNVKGWLEDRYQVILANSGAMAIKYLSLNRPDLVLLDYEMPVVDGKQVLEMIRSEVDFADIPVIFLTSKNDKESVANVVRLKPEGYLLKSMKPEEIVKYVDDFFIRQKGNRL